MLTFTCTHTLEGAAAGWSDLLGWQAVLHSLSASRQRMIWGADVLPSAANLPNFSQFTSLNLIFGYFWIHALPSAVNLLISLDLPL